MTSNTWTAFIEIASETLPAEPSKWDTLRETAKAAEREAAEMLRAGLGAEARVYMYKTTKARGTEYDRQSAHLWIEDSVVYVSH